MIYRTIALTGASGMVGRHVSERLAAAGIKAATTSRTRPDNLPHGFVWHPWDLTEWRDIAELNALFPDAQALLHVGAIVPRPGLELSQPALLDANVRACLCLGLWAEERGIPVVFVSSSTVYYDVHRRSICEDAATTTWGLGRAYGFSKLLGEQIFEHLSNQGLRTIVLRPSSIYGVGLATDKMIPRFVAQAVRGETIKLAPPVDDRVNLIHAFDVADAMLSALECQAWGTFNIANERCSKIQEVAEACCRVAGRGSVRVLAEGESREPCTRFDLDCGAARSRFGFSPQIGLDEGLRRCLSGCGEP